MTKGGCGDVDERRFHIHGLPTGLNTAQPSNLWCKVVFTQQTQMSTCLPGKNNLRCYKSGTGVEVTRNRHYNSLTIVFNYVCVQPVCFCCLDLSADTILKSNLPRALVRAAQVTTLETDWQKMHHSNRTPDMNGALVQEAAAIHTTICSMSLVEAIVTAMVLSLSRLNFRKWVQFYTWISIMLTPSLHEITRVRSPEPPRKHKTLMSYSESLRLYLRWLHCGIYF